MPPHCRGLPGGARAAEAEPAAPEGHVLVGRGPRGRAGGRRVAAPRSGARARLPWAAALPWEDTTLLGRLLEQLRSLGAGGAHVITRPQWMAAIEPLVRGPDAAVELHSCRDLAEDLRTVAALAAGEPGELLIASAEVITQREALAALLADPRIATGALVTRRHIPRHMAFGMQSRRGVIVRAASPYHRVQQSTETFLGVLKVSEANRCDVVQAAEQLAGVLEGPLPDSWRRASDDKARQWRLSVARRTSPGPNGEPDTEDVDPAAREIDELAAGARGRAVTAPGRGARGRARAAVAGARPRVGAGGIGLLRRLFWARALSAEDVADAETRIRDFDEERVLLELAVKANDGFFTTFFVSPYSRYVARWAARHGWSPMP